jgi:hypothetical protein
LATLPLAVVVLLARRNRIQDIEPLLPQLLRLLNHLPARSLRKVEASGSRAEHRGHR